VVFVRHALPGERVVVRVTEDRHPGFCRADAVEVLEASPDRVERPCPHSGPGLCGGCDWQHVAPAAQRELKAAVVREQLSRLAGLPDVDLTVEELPGGPLRWRSRARFAVDRSGAAGLRRHRSHDVVPVDACPIADPEVDAVDVEAQRWPGVRTVEVVAARRGPEVERLVVVDPGSAPPRRLPSLAAPASVAVRGPHGVERLRGRGWVAEQVEIDGAPRTFRVSGAGFWQVHPGAAQALLDAVLAATAPAPGERALDLYSGVGLFAVGLALRVGADGVVLGVESEPRAVADGRRNVHDLPQVRLEQARVDDALGRLADLAEPAPRLAAGVDVVVLDPPRTGAGRQVVARVLALRPRVVAYVACDPAALARDLAFAPDAGYRLAGLRAFDLFPMTHHVECVATLVPCDPGETGIS
jgi:tRNA/tmRNA/rRNA uracil-C5-methylase (TrmA/RlmC/RlmD family)